MSLRRSTHRFETPVLAILFILIFTSPRQVVLACGVGD
jgi:hypothetical protein